MEDIFDDISYVLLAVNITFSTVSILDTGWRKERSDEEEEDVYDDEDDIDGGEYDDDTCWTSE